MTREGASLRGSGKVGTTGAEIVYFCIDSFKLTKRGESGSLLVRESGKRILWASKTLYRMVATHAASKK